MILLDSNIIIYAAKPEFAYLRPLLSDPANSVSAFSMLEVLGYSRLVAIDKAFFEAAFGILQVHEIDRAILEQAILIRQQKSTSPGDALVAATALRFSLTLYTRNVSDFDWVSKLNVHNPVR